MEDFYQITIGVSTLIDEMAKISVREEISLAKLLEELGTSLIALSKDDSTLRKGLKLTKGKMKNVKTRKPMGKDKQKRNKVPNRNTVQRSRRKNGKHHDSAKPNKGK